MPYNSSTFTEPSVQILDRSFRIRSTIMTFSVRSLLLLYRSFLFCSSFERSSRILFDVPLMGCASILLPSFLRKRSGLAQSSHLSSSLYKAEKGLGEIPLKRL